ncbi:12-oxophytodienoate reductase [Micromonospora sp. BRA006-A]|nr:12-oxophytodienoate reductase [Micromonospora sp. BRA006-A]
MNAILDTASPVTPLLEPVTVAGLSLPSRFVMAPMTRSRAPGGVPTPEMAEYYRRRAASGVGLIVSEGVLVDHPSAGHEDTVPRMTAGAAEAGWRGVVEAVHAAGGGSPRSCGTWAASASRWTAVRRGPLGGTRAGPSRAVRDDRRRRGHLLAAYGDAAGVAVRAGFDAIEIHAAHGYLLDEFLWPYTNRRTDAFGGSPQRRAAFPAAVVRAVRAQVPAHLPVIVRFSQFKERAFDARIAETPAELARILGAFAEAGADVLHASQRRFWQPAFPGSTLNLAGWAKRLTGLPSITVGSVGLRRDFLRPDGPESVAGPAARLADGEFDLVALGRALLGNPAWVTHAAAGRLDEIVDYRKAHEDVYP